MRKKPWLATLSFILLTEAVGGLSALLSGGMELYESGIQKPPLSPPGIVFPIVWTILFALLGIGAARIYLAPDSPERTKALTLYLVQLAVNFFWIKELSFTHYQQVWFSSFSECKNMQRKQSEEEN